MRFVLIDESTEAGNAAEYGGPISPAMLSTIATALTVQLNRDVAPSWGGAYSVRAGASSTDVQPGEVVAAIQDKLSVDGAVAYHDVEGAEVPVVYLGREYCNSLTSGADSVSSALSHELCETAGDAFCNVWRDAGDGYDYCQELCDAVQEAGYAINVNGLDVAVSDFVLPAFFGQGAPGPWDYLGSIGAGAVGAPFATMSGGYQLRRSSGGGETQVQGEIAPRRLAKKRFPGSRTYRRGARV